MYPRVAVVEGPMDCVRAGADAVCTFGNQISGTQIGKFLAAGVRALDLMWDWDARQKIILAAPLLSSLFDLRLVFLDRGDPADHTRDELRWFRDAALVYRPYHLEYL
jgi:hypothetical protein